MALIDIRRALLAGGALTVSADAVMAQAGLIDTIMDPELRGPLVVLIAGFYLVLGLLNFREPRDLAAGGFLSGAGMFLLWVGYEYWRRSPW